MHQYNKTELADLFAFEYDKTLEDGLLKHAITYYRQVASQSFGFDDENPVVAVITDESINAFATSPSFDAIVLTSGLVNFANTNAIVSTFLEGVLDWFPAAAEGEAARVERQRFAEWFLVRTIDFVVFHELAHIRNGHTKFLREKYNFARMAAVEGATEDRTLLRDLQTMEYDADIFASNVVVIAALEGRSPPVPKNEDWEKDFDGATAVYSSLLAMYSFFKCIEEACQISEIPLMTHPPAVYRMAVVWQCAIETTRRRRDLREDIELRFIDILQNFEKRLPDEVSRKFDAERIERIFGDDTWKYIESMHSNWAYLRPQLEAYAMPGSLAPVQEHLG